MRLVDLLVHGCTVSLTDAGAFLQWEQRTVLTCRHRNYSQGCLQMLRAMGVVMSI